jgi:hypothetical protein
LPFSRIFSCMLVSSPAVFYCTVHHRGRVSSCCFQILWIVQTMRDYRVTYKSVPLICDSSCAICLTRNPIFHRRAKYIKVRHHFLRDHVEKGEREREMNFIDTERQLADIFTKPLDSSRFASLRGSLMFAITMAWFEGSL